MHRLVLALTVLIAAPLLGGAMSPSRTTPEVEAAGWRKMEWTGIRPARFSATPGGGIRIQARGEGAFITRALTGPATCLAWRWRVDAGPPATDLAKRGGDDRAIALSVGFLDFGPAVGLATRTQHALAQAGAGEHRLPRSVLSYVWGGSAGPVGSRPGFFPSPWTGAITKIRILRPAEGPLGQWVEERVDLAADWRAAFGEAAVPALQNLSLSTDSEDTGSTVDVQIENIRLVPCR